MPPSYNPSLHIARLPSAELSGVSLLDNYDSSKPQTHVSYGGRSRISIVVIVPGMLIFLASAGLASALLIWLQTRRIESHIPREDHYFHNAVVAIEGATAPHKLDDGSLESDTTMYGLAMSAVSAQLVALTVPFLLGLLGYRLASMWILAQENDRTESMPTAAQYGLLVKLCGSANIFSAYETMQYLKRGRERRSQAPSSLILAFAVLVVAIILNHLLSSADLWLHTTASTFIHTSMTEIVTESMPAMGTKINLTACPGPTTSVPGSNYYCNCARVIVYNDSTLTAYQWGSDAGIITEGLAVVGNSSSTTRSLMLGDMAVLVPSTMPDNVDNLTFNSFGLIAHCQPVVDCLVDYSPQSVFYCPSFDPPYNFSRTSYGLSPSSDSIVYMLNLTNNAFSPDKYGGYPLNSILNPVGAIIILYWNTYDGQRISLPENSPGWYPIAGGIDYSYTGTCSITAYNVSLSYSTINGDNRYAFADHPVLSNFNTTSALFAALDISYQPNLVDYLRRILRFSITLSTEDFNTALSRNIAYAAIGLASPLFERDVSTGGNAILLRSASRYPLAPLSAVLAILYTYAFLALAITVSSVMLSSREIVVTKSSGKELRSTAIELVQLRLTNALASIAERFSDPARPELLLEASAVDMFHEHPHADKLGVVIAAGNPEGEDGEPEGIVRRRRTPRVDSRERRSTSLSRSTITISET